MVNVCIAGNENDVNGVPIPLLDFFGGTSVKTAAWLYSKMKLGDSKKTTIPIIHLFRENVRNRAAIVRLRKITIRAALLSIAIGKICDMLCLNFEIKLMQENDDEHDIIFETSYE